LEHSDVFDKIVKWVTPSQCQNIKLTTIRHPLSDQQISNGVVFHT
jgi:hypothetical protein